MPKTVCQNFVVSLRQWSREKRSSLKFTTPMIWREPKNLHEDCYLCIVNGINSNNSSKWIYPDLPSVMRPSLVPILVQEPIQPVLPSTSAAASCQMETDDIIEDDKSNDPDFIPNF